MSAHLADRFEARRAAGALSIAEREALDRDGFFVAPNALDGASVDRLRRAFADAPTQDNGTQHVAILPATPDREAWLELSRHPILLAAALHVLVETFRVGDPHGRNPLPGYGQQGLHADWMARTRGSPYFVVTAIWMLDDFTTVNGATRIVPATHRLPRAIPKRLGQPLAHHPKERIVTGAAGSVLLFNGHLWHSGTRNESHAPRRAVQISCVRSQTKVDVPPLVRARPSSLGKG
jgi:ectoine hydroxylase-related dioxygenase (phytanoyl-CoA dioxygenase family)